MIAESILNARRIGKVLRSTSHSRRHSGETRYIINRSTQDGTLICTKGTIVREADENVFSILVSAKRARP